MQVVDSSLKHALGFDGGVKFGILGKVAEPACLRDLFGDPGHFFVLHLVELGLLLFVALFRHRNSVVGHPGLLQVSPRGPAERLA